MNEIIKQIRRFHQSPLTAELRDRIRQKTFPEILGVGLKENCHSNFLAWMLNPAESHELGNFALQKLLLLLASCRLTAEQQWPEELLHTILAGECIIRSADVQREAGISSQGRVDILVTIELTHAIAGMQRIRLVLENKIDAAETDGQTHRYYQYFSTQAEPGTYPIFVYLTRIHAETCQDPHFIHIDYQQILDTLLTPALQRRNLPEHTRFVLGEYVDHLTSFNSDSLYIAMNEQQRKLLIKFWDENSSLIIACAQALSEDPDATPELQESARSIVDQGKKVNRDRTKYTFQYKNGSKSEPLGKGRIVLQVVRTYALETECSFESLKNAFSEKWFAFYENVDLTAKPKRYFLEEEELLTLKTGEKIAVSSQCGGGTSLINFDDFVNKAQKLGFTITAQ